jgi:hypothetical protein
MNRALRVLNLVLLLPLPALAQAPAAPPADRATVADAYGDAQKRVSDAPERWVAVAVGDLLPPNSAVKTAGRAGMLLVLPDKHAIRVGENTRLELKEVGENRSYYFQLIEGEIWSFVNRALRPAKYEVETPSTILGVSGTLFGISFNKGTGESEMSVAAGVVSARQGAVTRAVTRGLALRVRPDQMQHAFAVRQDKSTEQMWKVFVSRETWMRPTAAPKIAKEIEADMRALRREHERAIQRQEQANPKTHKTPAKKPAKTSADS